MVSNMSVGPTRFATAYVTDVSSPAQDLWAESYRETSEEVLASVNAPQQ